MYQHQHHMYCKTKARHGGKSGAPERWGIPFAFVFSCILFSFKRLLVKSYSTRGVPVHSVWKLGISEQQCLRDTQNHRSNKSISKHRFCFFWVLYCTHHSAHASLCKPLYIKYRIHCTRLDTNTVQYCTLYTLLGRHRRLQCLTVVCDDLFLVHELFGLRWLLAMLYRILNVMTAPNTPNV